MANLVRFPRSSVGRVILMVLASLGSYTAFWLRDISRPVNRAHPYRRIGSWYFPVSVGLTCASLASGIMELLMPHEVALHVATRAAFDANVLLLVVWTFKVRNRVNVLLRSTKHSPFWLHGFWTAVFGIVYIQKQLNGFRASRLPARTSIRARAAHGTGRPVSKSPRLPLGIDPTGS
jgi:hypothetical protein